MLTIVSPDALIARRNVELAADGGPFDVSYVAGLSDDAVPVLVEALPTLDAVAAELLQDRLCQRPPPPAGPMAYNVARTQAQNALAVLDCPGR